MTYKEPNGFNAALASDPPPRSGLELALPLGVIAILFGIVVIFYGTHGGAFSLT
jgi:hypothetical protein